MLNDPLLRRLLGECRRFRIQLALAIASVGVLGASQLALTWLVKQWIEGPLATGDRGLLARLVVEGLVVMGAGTVSVFVSRVSIASVNQRLVEDLRNRAMARWLGVTPRDSALWPTGDLLSRLLNDAGALATTFGTVVRRLCREVVVAIGALVMLFVLDWRLASTVCLAAPLGAWLLGRIGRAIRRRGVRAQAALGNLGALANEQLHGLSTIKLFGGTGHEAARFAARSGVVRDESVRAEALQGLLAAAMFVVSGLALVALVWVGTFRLRAGGIPDAALVAFLLYAGQVVEPVRRLSDAHALLQGLLASAARVYEVIDVPYVEAAASIADPAALARECEAGTKTSPALAVPPDATDAAAHGAIDLVGVRVGYPGRPPVFSDVSLRVGAGEQLALVGSTGSGKTTLVKLLVAFVPADAGDVRVSGCLVSEWDVEALRAHVCLVEQEPFLFSGTIADNVRYGTWRATDEQVEHALRATGLGPLIDALPRGVTTTLSETGRQLSGGERQRIALARAIVRNPDVLILDEATSAIDSDTESALFESLGAWLARRTVICIAHRLSTVAKFPRVILLHAGQLAADGAPQSLMASSPVFAQLFAEQSAAMRAGSPAVPQ